MSINLDFGKYHGYSVSESRISRMMNSDRKSATYMSIWEKFKDFFRTDKKINAYNALYDFIHDSGRSDKLDTFNKLKSFAGAEYHHLFRKEIFCDNVVFFIDRERIGDVSIQKLINVSEETRLHRMSLPEQHLFMDMLDALREKELQSTHHRLSDIRNSASYELRFDLLNLYRPQEDMDSKGNEWKMADSITSYEEDMLRCLNAGNITSFSQFSFMGYQKIASGVEFIMVHPLISFLQGTYARDVDEHFSFEEINSKFLNVLNECYEQYCDNKTEIDKILKRIYEGHDESLNISYLGQNRNKLVTPFNVEDDYEIKEGVFTDELNEILSSIFEKWTNPDTQLSEERSLLVHYNYL